MRLQEHTFDATPAPSGAGVADGASSLDALRASNRGGSGGLALAGVSV